MGRREAKFCGAWRTSNGERSVSTWKRIQNCKYQIRCFRNKYLFTMIKEATIIGKFEVTHKHKYYQEI